MVYCVCDRLLCVPSFFRNEDFSALNKRTCESFFKITPENDKINFALRYQDSFAISLFIKVHIDSLFIVSQFKASSPLHTQDNAPFNLARVNFWL